MSNSTTLLDTIATNQSNKEAVVNALLDAASPAMLWGRHASACSGLTWGYYGGTYYLSGTANAIANGTVTLTASTTNYVYADATTGAVSVNTTGFPAGCIPLYQIVTGTTTVTSYTDERCYRPSAIASSGTVTSVAVSMPGIYSVSGSPITGSGTIAVTFNTQAANTALMGPTSGAAAAPTFRVLVGADIPVFGASGASHSQGGVPDPGATSGTTRFLREDGTWQVPAGSGGSSTLASLTDVNVTEGAGINGYSLTWNNATSKWVATNVSGGGGGSSISEGTFSSRPSAGTSGRLYFATDDLVASYDNGTSWDDYERGAKLTRPVLANFTLQNPSAGGAGATLTQSAFGVVLAENNSAGTTDSLRCAEIAVPASGSWTITARLENNYAFLGYYPRFGLYARDSASGRIAYFAFAPWGPYYTYETHSGFASWSGRTALNGANGGATQLHRWFRLKYDGTNFYFSISNNGQNWVQLYQVSATAYLTAAATNCGFFQCPSGTNYALECLSWAATTP